MSDTEGYLYRFSWDKRVHEESPWPQTYLRQPDCLAYLENVVKAYDLEKDMEFGTTVVSADWNDTTSLWTVGTRDARSLTCRYLVTALGLLATAHIPKLEGSELFQGEVYHTAAWPSTFDFSSKRVGVIGNGSTGVQVITELSKTSKHLTSFQRHPQFCTPNRDGPVTPELREYVSKNWDAIWEKVFTSTFGFGFDEATESIWDVSEEERERRFELAWQRGGAFHLVYGTFNDLAQDVSANKLLCAFIHSKIRETVKDPEKARKLCPTDLHVRRPVNDAGFYEAFNQDNVDLVLLSETPLESMTANGILTADGTEHKLDVVIYATGFEAVEGSYNRISINGRGGTTLKDAWGSIPRSYLGMMVPQFPNLFMVLGPSGPFANLPPAIEVEVNFLTDMIKQADGKTIEAEADAMNSWVALCNSISAGLILSKVDSWIFGANVGKTGTVQFFLGGISAYVGHLKEIAGKGYAGIKIM
ncbi:hypothetical protein RQP46_007886 [Phenoliferia psychrophenolica]